MTPPLWWWLFYQVVNSKTHTDRGPQMSPPGPAGQSDRTGITKKIKKPVRLRSPRRTVCPRVVMVSEEEEGGSGWGQRLVTSGLRVPVVMVRRVSKHSQTQPLRNPLSGCRKGTRKTLVGCDLRTGPPVLGVPDPRCTTVFVSSVNILIPSPPHL